MSEFFPLFISCFIIISTDVLWNKMVLDFCKIKDRRRWSLYLRNGNSTYLLGLKIKVNHCRGVFRTVSNNHCKSIDSFLFDGECKLLMDQDEAFWQGSEYNFEVFMKIVENQQVFIWNTLLGNLHLGFSAKIKQDFFRT